MKGSANNICLHQYRQSKRTAAQSICMSTRTGTLIELIDRIDTFCLLSRQAPAYSCPDAVLDVVVSAKRSAERFNCSMR
eukprot:scaffold450260_cov19-Prasinocladus_malaysianus.AAC.1